jgi:hypothetical protein
MLSKFDKSGLTILEVGSKEVVGQSLLKKKIRNAKYIGLDIQKGKNVDIIADAHEMSNLIENNSIDCVYSSSVFEWLSLAGLLKNKAVFVSSHSLFFLFEENKTL